MKRLSLLLGMLACLAVSQASATTVLYVGLDELIKNSDLIFHGTVVRVESRNLGTTTSPQLVTDVVFNVHRVLKGRNTSRTFELRLTGGSADGYHLRIPGQPSFQAGDEVVAILEKTDQGFTISALSFGLFRVSKGEDGKPVATRSTGGLCIVTRDGVHIDDPQDLPQMVMPLDELFTLIRENR